MPAFADLVAYFLDELFTLQPDIATAVGRPSLRRPVARHQRGRAAGPARVRRSLAQGVRRPRPGRAVARRPDRSRPGPGRARCRRVRRGDPPRGRLGPDAVDLPRGQRPAPAAGARVRAAGRAAGVGRRAGWRGSPPSSPTPGRPSAASPSARCRGSTPRSPASGSAGWPTSAGRRSRRPRPRRRRTRRSPRCCRGCGPRPTRRQRPSTELGRVPAPTRWRPPPRAARRSARRCSPRSCATRCATRTSRPRRSSPGPRREFAAVRAEMVRIARDAWPAWCGDRPIPDDEGALVRGVLDAIAADHPAADELRAVQPRRAGPRRGVLPRARA